MPFSIQGGASAVTAYYAVKTALMFKAWWPHLAQWEKDEIILECGRWIQAGVAVAIAIGLALKYVVRGGP